MDGDLSRLMAEQYGFFYRRQALDCGYSHREIESARREKEWVSVRRGAYTTAGHWESLDDSGRHVLTIRAVAGHLDGQVVVTGTSALAVQSVPLWGIDLRTVHVGRESCHSSRTDAHVVHHVAPIPASQLIEVDGLIVSRGERSVVDAARSVPFESGVVLADGAKRLLAFDHDLARSILESQRDWSGSLKASRVLRFSDGAAETVGESRSRVMIARLGLPAPQLQKCFYRSDGSVLARTDFFFEEFNTVGEFDGKQKYGRQLYEKSGRIEEVDLGEVVWQEKRREDAIRDDGKEMVRWVWFEVYGHDQDMRGRFARAFDRSGRRTPHLVT
jgi:hypothetical protein